MSYYRLTQKIRKDDSQQANEQEKLYSVQYLL
jgi:hypothetical protein